MILSYATLLTFSALYVPQPILPDLMLYYGVSKSATALLITLPMIPLSIAPLLYGYLLELLSTKKVLRISLFLLGVTQLLFPLTSDIRVALALRLMMGFFFPAIMTSLMTYITRTNASLNLHRAMAIYISSTIAGGYSGRLLSGFFSMHLGWQWVFWILGVSILISSVLISFLEKDAMVSYSRPSRAEFMMIIRNTNHLRLYVIIFTAFFVFAGTLNFLPFRLRELGEEMNGFKTGLMYTGYLMGIVTSLSTPYLLHRLKHPQGMLSVGFLIFAGSILLFNSQNYRVVFVGMFVISLGMFLVHTMIPVFLHSTSSGRSGTVNGLYISIYYAGGAAGSYFPGFAYHNAGWFGLIVVMGTVVFIGLMTTLDYLRVHLHKTINDRIYS